MYKYKKYYFRFDKLFPSSIIAIKKWNKNNGLKNISKDSILNEFYYLKEIIDMDDRHYKRLDLKNNFFIIQK